MEELEKRSYPNDRTLFFIFYQSDDRTRVEKKHHRFNLITESCIKNMPLLRYIHYVNPTEYAAECKMFHSYVLTSSLC